MDAHKKRFIEAQDAIAGIEWDADEALALERAAQNAVREANARERNKVALMSGEELSAYAAGDWGLFTQTKDCTTAIKELNRIGGKLVDALRNRREKGLRPAKDVMLDLHTTQRKYRHLGAEDTEGRHALWEIFLAVIGNHTQADDVWNYCY